MKKELNIGIDIGGTKVNIGIVDSDGIIIRNTIISTDAKKDPELFIKDIVEKLKELLVEEGLKLEDINFIGAGVPGTAEVSIGNVSYCPNLFWYDIPAGEYFEKYLGREVKIAQDSKNAALAELLFGAGRGYTDIVCVTIGTGIGGGIIINSKLFNGANNTAGEIGHTPIVKDGRKCVCGNNGCLEQYVSGTAILARALEKFPHKFEGRLKKSESVFDLAYEGDQEVIHFIEECVDYLAYGISNVVSLISPQAIIISGGLCVHEDIFIKPLEEKIYKRGYYSWTHLNALRVHNALLGSNAPMIGAAMLYKGI